MKKTIALCLSAFLGGASLAQTFEWAVNTNGSGHENGYSVFVDVLGNVYSTGRFQNTVDFDPGVGVFNLTSNGNYDAYIQKLDPSGNFLWAKSFGGLEEDNGTTIRVDPSGNVYTSGRFKNTVDFDPGVGTFNITSYGDFDMFVQKLDPSGNFLWAKRTGGSSLERCFDMVLDDFGAVYTTGIFYNTCDFDPGIGTVNLNAPNGAIFVQKLDASGNFVFAKQMGSTGYDIGNSLCLDASGNILIAGNFENTVDFDPGAGTYNLSSNGAYDSYVLKLDPSGNFLWAKRFGGTGYDEAIGIVTDDNGNVITTGYYSNTVDFDPGAGTYNLTSVGSGDIFIQKLDASGNFMWAKQMGAGSLDEGKDVAIDASGNIYTTGFFGGSVDFDPNAGVNTLTSVGGGDAFVQKLDASGNFIWAVQMGGGNASGVSDEGAEVYVDDNDNVYTVGHFLGTADFDPGVGVFNLSAPSAGFDGFVQKMGQCAPNSILPDVATLSNVNSECAVLAIPSPTASNCLGTFSGTPDVTFPITTQGTTVITWTYDDGNGNTSTQTQNVVISDVTAPVADQASLSDITSECDVTPTAPTATDNCAGALTGTPDVSFPITASGTTVVTWTYDDGNGNTSTQTQNVIITPIDNGVTQNDAITLTADATGYTYQWVDCDNGNAPINGQTAQTFVATVNGNYAVIIDNGTCSVTSACTVIDEVGIEQVGATELVEVYPNPTTGILYIHDKEQSLVSITLTNALGQQVPFTSTKENGITTLLLPAEVGVYYLILETTATQQIEKIIKH